MRPLLLRLFSRLHIDPYIWLVIAFSLFAVVPLASPGYFLRAHDAPQSVFFFNQFDAALRDGVWYPGWGTDQAWGYGYAIFVFYSPLAYYVAEVFHLLGAGSVEALKWTWALATVGAGLAMYAYGRHVLGRQRGLLAAVVYVYAPYHLLDIYVRAALAEYCAFVWMPLALLAFHRLIEQVTARRMAWAGLAFGAVWLTHSTTGMTFTLLLAAYVLVLLLVAALRPGRVLAARPVPGGSRAWRAVLGAASGALGAAMLGMGMAAALLLPGLLEPKYIRPEQVTQGIYSYAVHFVYPFQFLSSFWGYGAAGAGPVDRMSYQLGAVPLILAVVGVGGALRRTARDRALALFFGAATLALILLMLPIARPVWDALPIASLIQFPWRLLGLTALTLAVLAGLAVPPVEGARPDGRLLVVALVAVLGSFAYTLPAYTPVPDSAEGPRFAIEFEQEYPDMVPMTAWTQEMPKTSPMVEQYLSGEPLVTAEALAPGASVEMIRAAGASDEMWVRSAAGTPLRFYTYYFPGWRVYLDGRRLPDAALRPETDYGLLTVDVPPGEHRVLLRWGDTPLRSVGKALTVGCLLLALALALLPPRGRAGRSSARAQPGA
jgi:hypothetical protein